MVHGSRISFEIRDRGEVSALCQYFDTGDDILHQVDNTLDLFTQLQLQHQAVATKTKTLHDKCDRMGGKGITDLKPALQNIFGETLVETKDELLQNFSDESHFISSTVSNEEKLQCTAYKGDTDLKDGLESAASNVEVVRMKLGDPAAGHLYSRLIPLVLLLVDGSNPIDVTDPSWELYLLIQKNIDEQNTRNLLLGFSAMYRFYHYPDSSQWDLRCKVSSKTSGKEDCISPAAMVKRAHVSPQSRRVEEIRETSGKKKSRSEQRMKDRDEKIDALMKALNVRLSK